MRPICVSAQLTQHVDIPYLQTNNNLFVEQEEKDPDM